MDTVEIIWQIDAEISRLQQARVLLSESDSGEVKRKPGRPKGSGVATTPAAQPPKAITQPRRKMSAAGRARISAAMTAYMNRLLPYFPGDSVAKKRKQFIVLFPSMAGVLMTARASSADIRGFILTEAKHFYKAAFGGRRNQ